MPCNEDLKHRWDWKNAVDYAVEEAVEEAERETLKKVASKLKKEKMSLNNISRITGLSMSEIQKL